MLAESAKLIRRWFSRFFKNKYYGSPKNYDAEHPEHNHKYTAKIPGWRLQKTNVGSEFEYQVAIRVSQAIIIDELYEPLAWSKLLFKTLMELNLS